MSQLYLGQRWLCTSDDGKTWFAGPDYKYEGKLASEILHEAQPPGRIPKTIDPTETGVDGKKIFKVVEITEGKNPQAAIDGKKSTYSEGKELIAELAGVGYIRTFALKFEGGPYTFEIKVSLNGTDYLTIPLGLLTSDIKTPADTLQYFILPDVVPATWISCNQRQL